MSAALTAAVWQAGRSRLAAGPAARLVLLALADQAGTGRTDVVISVQSIGQLTGLSRRGVQVAVTELEQVGDLVVTRTTGARPYNRYTLTLGEGSTLAPPDGEGPRPRRRKTRSRFRFIWDRNGWTCQVRGPGCTGHRDLTVGHILSIAAGGTDDDDNLQTECNTCNSTKGAR